ncbi:MAG: iron ABC transporter permease [Limnochordaceae bacterium]|nr:iron ABC transporter permease [Limnochordaceae bacterium]
MVRRLPVWARQGRFRLGGLVWALPTLFLLTFLVYPLILLVLQVAVGPAPLSAPAGPPGAMPLPATSGVFGQLAAAGQEVTTAIGHLARGVAVIGQDPYFRSLIRFTAWQALLSTLLSVLIGLPIAALLSNYTFRGRALLRSLTLVPFVLPPISVALGFILMYGNNGWLNRFLAAAFGVRLSLLYSLPAILLAHAFYNAPVLVRTVSAAWQAIDPSLEEAARSLGASPRRVFWTVTLPALVPGIATGAALAFVFSFLSFPLVLALGGARFATVEVEIYTQIRILLNYRTGAALALVETILSLAFSYGYLWLEGRFARPQVGVRPHPLHRLEWPRRPGAWVSRMVAAVTLAAIAVFYVGPILALVVQSARPAAGGGGPAVAASGVVSGWTLQAYRYVFTPEYDAIVGDSPLASIRNSLVLATATMLVSLLVATPLAYAFAGRLRVGRGVAGAVPAEGEAGHLRPCWGRQLAARLSRWGTAVIETAAMAPLAISSVALGFALLQAFNRPPLAGLRGAPALAIVAAHSVLAYPFVIRTLRPALEAIGPELPESARLLGANRWQAFRTVELPLAATGLLSGALLSFAMSLSETSATILLAGPGLSTMPITLYHLLSARNFGGASAMAVVLLAVTGLCFVGVEAVGQRWVYGRNGRRARGSAE